MITKRVTTKIFKKYYESCDKFLLRNTRALTFLGFKKLLKSLTISPDLENMRSAGVEDIIWQIPGHSTIVNGLMSRTIISMIKSVILFDLPSKQVPRTVEKARSIDA